MPAQSQETTLLYRVLRELRDLKGRLETIEGIMNADIREPDRLISAKEAAQILSYHEKTIRRMAQRGIIPFKKEGKSYRFSLNEIRSRIRNLNPEISLQS